MEMLFYLLCNFKSSSNTDFYSSQMPTQNKIQRSHAVSTKG